MKNNRIILKLFSAALLTCSAGFAAAADSTTLAVTASVDKVCKFSATSTSLPFGVINPSSTVNAIAKANVLYKCTKGTASLGVTVSGGLTRSMTSTATTDTLGYTLAYTGDSQTGTGFGSGQDLTMAVTGTITPAQFQNVTGAAYSENVTLNITP